jgi:hypothetical protein
MAVRRALSGRASGGLDRVACPNGRVQCRRVLLLDVPSSAVTLEYGRTLTERLCTSAELAR